MCGLYIKLFNENIQTSYSDNLYTLKAKTQQERRWLQSNKTTPSSTDINFLSFFKAWLHLLLTQCPTLSNHQEKKCEMRCMSHVFFFSRPEKKTKKLPNPRPCKNVDKLIFFDIFQRIFYCSMYCLGYREQSSILLES